MVSPSTDRRFGLVGNTPMKAPVDLATTANITLNGEQSIDGTVTSSSRVLVKDQVDQTKNGIYDTGSGDWTRALDADGSYDLVKGTAVYVAGGSTNANVYYTVTSSNPITVGTSAITFAVSVAAGNLAAQLASTAIGLGTGLIGWLRNLANSVATTLYLWMHAQAVNVKADFGADNTGAVDATTAIANAYSASKQLVFPAGTYKVSALPNFAVVGTRIVGIGRVIINYTGATIGLNVDSGTGATLIGNIEISNLEISASGVAATGAYLRGIRHSKFRSLRFRNFTTTAFSTAAVISNIFEDIYSSQNEDPAQSTVPVTGLKCDADAAIQTSDNTWINICMEGVSGSGIHLVSAIMNTFVGGTSEGNATGVTIDAACGENKFDGLDMEANTVRDISVNGVRNSFENCFATSTANPVLVTGGATNQSNSFIGGEYDAITIDANCTGTILDGIGFNASGAGVITDNGTGTIRRGIVNIGTAAVQVDHCPQGVIVGLSANSVAAAALTINANAIAPTTAVCTVGGAGTIKNITAPAPIASTGGQITIIPLAGSTWVTDATGNIALATTAVPLKAVIMTYDATATKWYPSY